MVRTSVGVVTALTPYIGYAAASALAKTALLTGRDVADLVVEAGLMDRERVRRADVAGAADELVADHRRGAGRRAGDRRDRDHEPDARPTRSDRPVSR